MAKKYISKFVKDDITIYVKDTEARESLLYPIDISTLTPSSSFTANSVLGINGVLYKCINNTSSLPVTLQVEGNAFVTHTINGKTAFVVTDPTLNEDWEIFTDASIEYWINALSERITSLEGLSVTYDGTTYTLSQLMTAMAQLMSKTIVINA